MSLYVCSGCGKPGDDELVTLWIRDKIGLGTIRACATQECAKAALTNTGYKLCKDNLPPMPPEERAEALKRREAAREHVLEET